MMNIWIIALSILLGLSVFRQWRLQKHLRWLEISTSKLSLHQHEQQRLFESAQVGLMYINSERILLSANQRVAEIFGYDSPDEMQGISMRHLHLSEQRFIDYGAMNFDSLRMGVRRNIEYQLRKKNGEPIWCELSGTALDEQIPADLSKGVLWVVSDISLRKHLQQELEKSEYRYRSLFKNNQAIALLIEQESQRIFDCNDKALAFYGYSYEEMLKKSMADINTLSAEAIAAEIKAAIAEKQNLFHFKHRLADGSIHDVEVYSGPMEIDDKKLLFSIVFDITEHMRLVEEKQLSQERLSYAMQGGNDGLWDWYLGTNTVYYSPRWKLILGYEDHELENHFSIWEELVHPDDIAPTWEELDRFINSKDVEDRFSTHFRMRHKDGHYVPILSRAQKQYNEQGVVHRLIGTHVDLTELVAVQQAYKAERDRSQQYLDTAEVLLIALDKKARITMLNRKGEELLGFSEAELLGKVWFEIGVLPEPIAENIRQFFHELLATAHLPDMSTEAEHELLNRHGQRLVFSFRSSLLFNDKNEVIGLLSSGVDITERVQAQKALKQQHDFLQSVINSVGDSIMVIDKNYHVSLMNDMAKAMMDKTVISDPEHPRCYEAMHQRTTPCQNDGYHCPLQDVINHKKSLTTMHTRFDKQGRKIHMQFNIVPLFDEQGNVHSIIESGHDITKLTEAQKNLQHQAEHDALTGLPNRVLFLDRLHKSLLEAKSQEEKLAVFFIDLDHFKAVNDSLGHLVGDQLLKQVAQRFADNMYQDGIVARLGGDEFAIICEHICTLKHVIGLSNQLNKVLHQPIMIAGHEIFVSLSIGIAIYPNDGDSPETLLKNADAAMYKAKNNGRDTYQFYTEDMTARALERITLETQLRQSIDKGEMQVYYQLQINANTQTLIGMEALLRWHHPEKGLLSPDKFIPLAEETGFIVTLDEWGMQESIKQWQSWQAQGFEIGTLSLNLSMLRLEKPSFLSHLKHMLKKHQATSVPLCFEITESQIMKNPKKAIKTFEMLRDLGIKLAIDDFGTGYSSLAYLKKLPLDKLKIDRSFIENIPHDNDDMEITRTIISMASGLGLNVIAEGVETQAQQDFLLAHGCNEIQGYFYHKPAPVAQLEPLLMAYQANTTQCNNSLGKQL